MSITVVISAQVSDFDLWKSKLTGLRINALLLVSTQDPTATQINQTPASNRTAPSKEVFVEFFTSPDRQAIQDSG
ncbi:MAG: hypothetical protein CM1200mP39_30910 [Dehalococcoidia bacterium]|nr:MAG: hypothetical protein CM1200mP39_30910 [Dehalococcoidia bacterium]